MIPFTCPVCGQPADVQKRVAKERFTQVHFTCLHCGETGMDYEDIVPLPMLNTAQANVREALHRYVMAAKQQHFYPLDKELKRMREETLAEFKQALRHQRGKVPQIEVEEDDVA